MSGPTSHHSSSCEPSCKNGVHAWCAQEHRTEFSTLCTSSFSDARPSDQDVSLEEEEIGDCTIPVPLQTTRTCFGYSTFNIVRQTEHLTLSPTRSIRPIHSPQRNAFPSHETPTERFQGVGLGDDQLACRAFQRKLHHARGQNHVNIHMC